MNQDMVNEVVGLIQNSNHAVLGSHSKKHEGFPFCTSIDYVYHNAKLYFIASSLAQHTINILNNNKISLFIGDSMNQISKRATIIAKTNILKENQEEIRSIYLKKFPDSENLLMLDFSFFEITIESIRYIGGPAMARWFSPKDIF